MKIVVQKYTNIIKMQCVLDKLSEQQAFRYLTIRGSVFRKNGEMQCKGDNVIVFISYTADDKNTMMALLYYGDCSELDGKTGISLDEIPKANVNSVLINSLLCKFKNTNNEFSLTCSLIDNVEGDNENNARRINIKASKDNSIKISLIDKNNNTKMLTNNSSILDGVCDKINRIEEFDYTVTASDGGTKRVNIVDSNIELYRELSKYLNKTIVLVSLDDKKESIVEHYINSSNALEVKMKSFGLRTYSKKPIARLKMNKPFTVYFTNSSIIDVTREMGRVLNKK